MKSAFSTLTQLTLIASLALTMAACKQEEAAVVAAKPAMSVPATDDSTAWREYVQDVIGRNIPEGLTNQPYVYFLPGESTEDFAGSYERLSEKAKSDVARGIVAGNMLAYVSPASGKMADMIVDAFAGVQPDTMKDVRVLFIGKAEDNERVKAAVTPAGVNYVFIEAK